MSVSRDNTQVILTNVSDESKGILSEHFDMCPCCGFEGAIFLFASLMDGDSNRIHGMGYGCKELESMAGMRLSPDEIVRLEIADYLRHGKNVLLMPDVHDFIEMVNKLKEVVEL